MFINSQYKHRTAEIKLTLFGDNQVPLKNREVVIRQIKQKFLFGGGCFFAIPFANNELNCQEKEISEVNVLIFFTAL